MKFNESNSYCIICMPRTGSELLMNFLAQSKLLHIAGEFMNIEPSYRVQIAQKIGDTGNFVEDHQIIKYPDEIKYEDVLEYTGKEFNSRIKMLRSFEEAHGPVVFKVFSNVLKFEPHYSLQYLLENYNVIVLTRRDIFSAILSGFICERINFWHGMVDTDYSTAKEKLEDLQITIPPHKFYEQLCEYNNLVSLQLNLFNKFPGRVVPLIYEDFAGGPEYMLNKFFNSNSKVSFTQQKFIDDHKKYVTNLGELETLYRIYGAKHENSSLPKWSI